MVEGVKIGMRVAHEEPFEPDALLSAWRKGTVVGPGRELGTWWVEMDDDGEEVESELREDWRAEPDGVAFVNRLHPVQAQPVAVSTDRIVLAWKALDAALRGMGITGEWGACPTFQDVDEAETPHGLALAVPKDAPGFFERRAFQRSSKAFRFRQRELHALLERTIRFLGLAPKVRWHEGASSFTYHLYFRPIA